MSANSSSSSDASPSTNIYSFLHQCINSTAGVINMTAFTVTNFLFVPPLYVFVIYLGLKRWWQQRPGTTVNHSDIFTYNMAVIDLMSVFGSTFTSLSVHSDFPEMMTVGIHLFIINMSGQTCIHLLTCVERYLAVVHPVTYLSLRKAKGVRIRNITIGCVWLLCFAGTGLLYVADHALSVAVSLIILVVLFVVISFFSLSVIYVLIRPGPGEGGGSRQRVDQSKLRAFYTIIAILGVLVLRFGGNVLISALYDSVLLGDERCGLWFSMIWVSLPSSLVLPLLFLQRAGKMLCCKNNSKQGQGPD